MKKEKLPIVPAYLNQSVKMKESHNECVPLIKVLSEIAVASTVLGHAMHYMDPGSGLLAGCRPLTIVAGAGFAA